jgi:hypothetical protein
MSPPFLIDACECCEKQPAGANAYMDDEATVLCADCYMEIINDPAERRGSPFPAEAEEVE